MDQLNALAWKDIITVGLASIGAVLGVMNTWNALSQRRVRLVVRPAFAFPNNGGPPMLSISVTNFSNFPLTITEVGFAGPKGAKRGPRAMIVQPQVIDGKPWPRRLASREAISLYFGVEDVAREAKVLAKAYAGTECGEYAYGTSPALDQLRDLASQEDSGAVR
ncbi:hypothetical protein V1290_000219 [Bradyrhizobium sp. AZCC 1578]|uniref:hypothetical protein n=1 Tax=Bradyrhizobium sp. AZCC 1578 TaxID=3117027 RepID=UPI002FF14B7A